MGSFGNKGCIFFEFEYLNNKYGFCSGHLCAGQKEKNFLIDVFDPKKELLDYFKKMDRKLVDDIDSEEFVFDKFTINCFSPYVNV